MNPAIPWFFRRALVVLIAAAALLYAGDYLILRVRMTPKFGGNAFGTVTVYDATTTKSGKTEIFFELPTAATCVHSLFPHLGDPPCWYLVRSPIRLITFVIRLLPAGFQLPDIQV